LRPDRAARRGRFKLDPAGAVADEAQVVFDLDQELHVAVGADQFDDAGKVA
jgi:hypothetical protein